MAAKRQFQEWPAWRYDLATGAKQIFESADQVPDGWVDSLRARPVPVPDKPAPEPAEKEAASALTARERLDELVGETVTRQEIIAELAKFEIEHKGNASTEDLAAKLLGVLDAGQ